MTVAVSAIRSSRAAALSVEGHEAELIDDEQVGTLQALRQATEFTLVTGLEQLAHEVGGPHEAHVLPTSTHLDADGDPDGSFRCRLDR